MTLQAKANCYQLWSSATQRKSQKQQNSGPVVAEWAAPQAFWSGQEGPERDFHLHTMMQVSALTKTWKGGGLSAVHDMSQCDWQMSKRYSHTEQTETCELGRNRPTLHSSCHIWSHLHVRGAAPEVLWLRPPDTSASLLLSLCGSHHYKVHTCLASLHENTHTHTPQISQVAFCNIIKFLISSFFDTFEIVSVIRI